MRKFILITMLLSCSLLSYTQVTKEEDMEIVQKLNESNDDDDIMSFYSSDDYHGIDIRINLNQGAGVFENEVYPMIEKYYSDFKSLGYVYIRVQYNNVLLLHSFSPK